MNKCVLPPNQEYQILDFICFDLIAYYLSTEIPLEIWKKKISSMPFSQTIQKDIFVQITALEKD